MINSMIEEEMPMLRRGFIYLKNNKKRGLLLTGILFVMAMFLFVGGDIRKAAGEELKTVQKQMGGSIQVKADTENQALYVADPDDLDILTFNGSYYEMIDLQKTTDPNMAECDMKENYIFVDTGFVRQVMGEVLGEEITAYSHGAVFYVEDVASLDQIVEQAEEIPGYYWKGYVIEKNNKEYHDLAEPLIRMDRFLMIFIAAICVCGVIILGLILIMWTRNRLHEAGILLSMGISRYAVAGQYLLENLLVMLGAYPIAWILGFLAVGPIGARMGLELQLDSLSILAAAGIGCGIVAVSTLLASVRIFRMEPKEILSMD